MEISQPILQPFSQTIIETTTRPVSRGSRLSRWATGDSRKVVSRSASVATDATGRRKLQKKNSSRRPTIGAPSEFRRVDVIPDVPKVTYRPLELSIYVPGNRNRLSPLPVFSRSPPLPPVAGIRPPPTAIVRSESSASTTPSYVSTMYSIPRKPVALFSRSSPTDSRTSMDSSCPSMYSSVQSRSYPALHKAAGTLPQSTQDFLDLLGNPHIPPPVPLKIRSSLTATKPIRRNASDQNMRLKNHLDERQEIEARLKDFDAIVEEWKYEPEFDEDENVIRPEPRLSKPRAVSMSTLPYARRPLPEVPQVPQVPQAFRSRSRSRSPRKTHSYSASVPNLAPPLPARNPLRAILPQSQARPMSFAFDEEIHGPYADQLLDRPPSMSTGSDSHSVATSWSTPLPSPRVAHYAPWLSKKQMHDLEHSPVHDVENAPEVVGYGIAF